MKDELDLSDPIATRTFALADGEEVRVAIGRPFEPDRYPGEYWCPYRIEGLGKDRVHRTIGVDSMQALTLTLELVGTLLYDSDEAKDGRLTWNGDLDLGLPVLPSFRDLLPRSD